MNEINLSKKNLISKFFDGLFLNILLRVKGVIYLPILVNFFSKSDIGLLSLWQSVSSLLMGIYLLNIPDSSNRIILEYKKNDDTQRIQDTISTIFSFSFIMYFVVSLFIAIVYFTFLDNKNHFFEILLLLVFSKILSKLALFIFQIFQKSKLIMKVQLIIEYGSLLIVLFGIYIIKIESIQYVIFTYIFVSIGIALFLFIKLYVFYAFRLHIDYQILKKLLMVSLFLLPNAYALLIIQNSDFIMIRYFWSLNEVGEYSFAYSISSVVSGLSMAVTFFWYSSAVYADNELLSKMVNKINTYMPILLLLTTLFYYFITVPLINVINTDYLGVNSVIQILIVGLFINIYIQILSGTLYAKGKEKLILTSVLTGVLVNVILNLILIPKYGLIGGALATTMAYLIIFIIQYIYVRNILPTMKTIRSNVNVILLLIISFVYIIINFTGSV